VRTRSKTSPHDLAPTGTQPQRRVAASRRPTPWSGGGRWHSLIEALSAYFWEVDEQVRFTYLSPETAQISGYAPGEMLGKTPFEFMAPDEAVEAQRHFAGIIDARGEFTLPETPTRRKDGTQLYLELRGFPIFDKWGRFKGYQGISRDVTQRVRGIQTIEQRDAILHAVSRAVVALQVADDFRKGMAEALRLIGDTMKVDRVLVIESSHPFDAAKPVSLSYSWQAPDVPVNVDSSFFRRPEAASPEVLDWYAPLAANQPVIASNRTATGPVAEVLRLLQIKSVLLVPIHVEGVHWGNLGIDACKEERHWAAAEIDALRTLAEVIGAAITRERYVAALAMANKIVNSTPAALFRLAGGPEFPLTYIAGNLTWFGLNAAEMLAAPTSYKTLIAPDDMAKIAAVLNDLDSRGAPAGTIEYRHLRPDRTMWVEARFNPVRDAEGKLIEIEGLLTDITERKQADMRMALLARTDALTGLNNRRVFVDATQQAVARARRGGKRCAVLYLDLDHFKDINDTLGHPIGDRLLQEIAARLTVGVRETDIVARFGGDEFAVLQSDLNDPTDAGTLAGKLIEVVARPFSVEGNTIRAGTSIGIALCEPEENPETLLSHADVALYRAKADGRGTYRFFTEAMDIEVHRRVALAGDLRDAIAKDQLFLMYQPQVEVTSGRIIGLEALVRWRHPSRGLLPPPDFVGEAERSGLIGALGGWVLHAAASQLRQWYDIGLAVPRVAVNVSSLQFRAPIELERDFLRTIGEAGVPANAFEIELTESALMRTSDEHKDVLQRLRERGVTLAIDDFGTGFSSLSYLRRLPLDRIKIAQDFVRDIATDPSDAVVVKAAIGLARELNLDVIAEGVETAQELEMLQSWGCSAVQGFYFSKPLAASEVEPLLRRGTVPPAGG
jgi:diguanylate cyclase (GGDEF)-like protein/PAS domain S-box-containing protein